MVEEKCIIENTTGDYTLVLSYSNGQRENEFTGSLAEILAYIQLREMGVNIL